MGELKSFVFNGEQIEKIADLIEQAENGENDPRSINYRRKLNRPKIKWVKIAIVVAIPIAVSALLILLFGILRADSLVCAATVAVLLAAYFAVLSKRAVICLIHIYQHYAPDSVRNKCRFEPSCSEYMIVAIEKYGLLRGIKRGIQRLLRCKDDNGGYDYP